MSTPSRWHLGALALAVPALVFALGCGGSSNNPPVKESDNTLSSLVASRGILSPAFTATTTKYTLTLASGTPFTVTPTVNGKKATVQVNGKTLTSGSASEAIPMSLTPAPLEIKVTAEDGSTQTYTVTPAPAGSTQVQSRVLGSVGGATVSGATLTVADDQGVIIDADIPTSSTGTTPLFLDSTKAYNLYAQKAGQAQSCLSGFRPAQQKVATHYCQLRGMTNFPATAPVLSEFAVSADGTTWSTVADGLATGTAASMKYLKTTFLGRCQVAPADWAGFGVGLYVDGTPNLFNLTEPLGYLEEGKPVTVKGETWYRSTAVFSPAFATLAAGDVRTVSVVAYDVANNRTEAQIQLKLTDATDGTTDPDISAVAPSNITLQAQTYGLARDIYALPPAPGKDTVTAYSYVGFSMVGGTPAANIGIRGFEVYRSADQGSTWQKIGAQHYASLTAMATHALVDADATLVAGQEYQYKVRAYTANKAAGTGTGFSADSAAIPVQFMKPFIVDLSAPATGTISTSLNPTLAFTVNEPSLLDAAISDYFYFVVIIKEKGSSSYTPLRFRYDLATKTFRYRTTDTAAWSTTSAAPAAFNLAVDATTGTFSLKAPIGWVPGKAYEWTVAGFHTSGGNPTTSSPAQFRKTYYNTGGNLATAFSFGSNSNVSNSAENGYFTLIIDPSAQ